MRSFTIIMFSVLSFTLLGCSQLIPVYERTYGNDVIKEKEIGIFNDKKNSLDIDNKQLLKIVSLFKDSSVYLQEKSKIEKLIFDPDSASVRIQLKNDRYFIVTENVKDGDLTIIESGVIGRAR